MVAPPTLMSQKAGCWLSSFQQEVSRPSRNEKQIVVLSLDVIGPEKRGTRGYRSGEIDGELAPAGKRDTEALERRMEIRRLVEEYDTVLSCHTLQRMLQAAGIKGVHLTVMSDLKAKQLCRVLFSAQVRGEVREC
jgi:hypothetical protein